jgi:hypothetical protein
VTITGVEPNTGTTLGGTTVTIFGTNFVVGGTSFNFGVTAATGVSCASTTTCTAVSPAHAAGIVDVTALTTAGISATSAADQFTYGVPTAGLYAWGITAPKGGAVWLPNNNGGGSWWSSDHAQGLCRQDAVTPATVKLSLSGLVLLGTTLHAINFAVCGDDTIGSAGQAVYDPRTNANGTHYVYVPDNAVRSTSVWRLTFDPATEKMVPDPLDGVTMATAMAPLVDQRTLKPNGMALGPVGANGVLCGLPTSNCTAAQISAVALYTTDLVERYVRKVSNPNGDPRTQTITIVAETGDGRGANGTQGFIGSRLYISGNRATQFIDVSTLAPAATALPTQCPEQPNGVAPIASPPCGMASVPAPTGIFVAGTATDPARNFVYISNSPGGANAGIFRYNASLDRYVPFIAGTVVPDAFGVVTCPACTVGLPAVSFVTGGNLPVPGSANGTVWVALNALRPWDQTNHPVAAGTTTPVPATFSFAFGLAVSPGGDLIITEDPSAGARSGRGTMWLVPFQP